MVTLGGAPPSFQINQPMVDQDARPGTIRPYAILAGLPMFVSEKCSTLGTVGDVVLFDPLLYVIGDRSGVMVDFSNQDPATFGNDQSTFRVLKRGDGQPQISGQITLADAASKVSPYIILK